MTTEWEFIPQSEIQRVSLTKTEQRLLDYLQLHRGRAITRQELLENVWKTRSQLTRSQLNTRTVDIHIAHLRRKLHLQDKIKTVFRKGYIFC